MALGLYEFGAAVVYSVEFDATVWNETGGREIHAFLILLLWATMSVGCSCSRVKVSVD